MKIKTHFIYLLFSILIFASCNTSKVEKLSVKGKDIVTEKGEVIRLKGVSFSDPDKLETDGQWNQHYFQEAKNWGCNVVRFAVHPTRLNDRGWDAYFELMDQGVKWAAELDMYVIIDWHSIGNLNTEKWSNKIKLNFLFSDRFKSKRLGIAFFFKDNTKKVYYYSLVILSHYIHITTYGIQQVISTYTLWR